MKICPKCGNRNFYGPTDKIVCKGCGVDLKEKAMLLYPEYLSSGCSITKKKLLHDECPWDFTYCDY